MSDEQTERSQSIEGAEKKALDSPAVQPARNATAAQVGDAQSANPNKFESMTELPTVKDGVSLEEAQQSFGIHMGDNTVVTSKGVQASKAKGVSIDPRPSYVEGLQAIADDEESQGRFSIEYMERKAREALASLQNPLVEQTLLASNITSSAPNLEQMQGYTDIGSDSETLSDTQIAIRDDYFNKSEFRKLIPKDRDNITLKQLIEDYKTSFVDAYERSKNLKDGDPGKSRTLESVVDRLKQCPWADKIHVKFDSRADNTEYDELTSTIVIKPQDSIEKQTEGFAHEGFHATHQFLSKLYDHGIVGKKEYVNIWMGGEVDSMLTEARVQRDLNKNGEPTKFYYIRADNGQKDFIEILDYASKHGRQSLLEFLRTAQPATANSEPYGKHYEEVYSDYVATFQQNKPAAQKYISQWERSGYKREEI